MADMNAPEPLHAPHDPAVHKRIVPVHLNDKVLWVDRTHRDDWCLMLSETDPPYWSCGTKREPVTILDDYTP